MKTLRMMVAGAFAGSVMLLAGSTVGAQTKTLQGEMVTHSVTVEAIEQSTRTLTVKDANGVYETIAVPSTYARFAEIKVGSKITVRYYDNVVVRLKKPGEAAVDVDTAALTRGTGASPAGTAATQRTITVTVTAMDPKTLAATVRGPNGYVYSRKMADKKSFDMLKVGDQLDMTWTEALLISVDPPK